jgi:uncharacterized protein
VVGRVFAHHAVAG